MTQEILSIGTKLADKYGTWIVTTRHLVQGSYWYDIRPDRGNSFPNSEFWRGERTLCPSNLKFYTILK